MAMPAALIRPRKHRTNWKEGFEAEIAQITDFGKGGKKAFYQDFAERHSIAWETVKRHHLSMMKDDLSAKESTEKLVDPSPQESKLSELQGKPVDDTSNSSVKPGPFTPTSTVRPEVFQTVEDKLKSDPKFVSDGSYYVGGYVEMIVERVEPRFVKVKTTDGFGTEGLLYIAEICHSYVADCSDHFMINDRFIGEILNIDGLGRLKISTKNLPIKSYRNGKPQLRKDAVTVPIPSKTAAATTHKEKPDSVLADKLAAVKDKLPTSSVVSAAPSDLQAPKGEDKPQKPADGREERPASSEMMQVRKFVDNKLGYLSERSEGMLQDLIEKHGIVNFTMAMAQVLPGFEVDMGIYFAREIDAKLSGGL